ncbi:MAG TPA: hypothetical protein VM013_07640 [Dehalococcoidia bacterium]|nr:hypothetical protein [Dehalococcoidia bacterium]
MAWEMSGWTVSFHGCTEKDIDCHAGKFDVRRRDEPVRQVEVLTTAQIEHVLAGEMGKKALSDEEREIILAVAGKHLIEQCIEEEGRVPSVLYLSGQIFLSEGAERRLLQECGLVAK